MGMEGRWQESSRPFPYEEGLACTSFALSLSCFHVCLCPNVSVSLPSFSLFSHSPFTLPAPASPPRHIYLSSQVSCSPRTQE